MDARENILDALERDKTLFQEGPVGQKQLDLLLACVDLDRRELLRELLALLNTRLSRREDWVIPPGAVIRALNVRRLAREGRSDPLYRYCRVAFPGMPGSWSYRTEDMSLWTGDHVLAPFGPENTVLLGCIIAAGDYTAAGAPWPVEKTKFLIGPADRPDEDRK